MLRRAVPPHPKPVPRRREPIRIEDPKATLRACLAYRECPCGAPSATGHHILARGAPYFGDDLLCNIVPLCGSGTTGCHGQIENEDELARMMLGIHLQTERLDVVAYVIRKLGGAAGAEWFERRLFLRVMV